MTHPATRDPGVEIAMALRRACEAHDPSIAKHLDRVSRYATELARHLGLPTATLIELHYAAPLHDIGKLGLPLGILYKPGQLTTEEREIVKTHTFIGYGILDGSNWRVIQCAAQIALAHHECWDGSGYPHGLKGEEIPLVARIVSVADVYDALVSRRAYKPAWSKELVLQEMLNCRGTKFDPAILDVFIQHIDDMVLPVDLQELRATG
jgi:putative two-component system response regulator